MISCKLHKIDNEDDMKTKINSDLPIDIKIFSKFTLLKIEIIEVSKSFDAKDSNNNREYHYILPSFCLKPKVLDKYMHDGKDNLENFKGDYNFKITPEYHEKIMNICKFYKGTKKYHNYTKKMSFSDESTNRHIYELTCNELIENESFQAIKFKIIGQSFLYNQIRKMIGFIIQICREELDSNVILHSFYSNKMDIPKAPAEGLYLYKVI
jgi:tRNA pseudouridine38-40 synthase